MSMNDFRRMALAMDQRVRQLRQEGVGGQELIHRMVGHLPDLQKIWVGTNDEQLAQLCQDYPGFYQYASLMEEGAEAQRANPNPKYQDLPELNDPLKQLLAALLTDAATLEYGYQKLLNSVRGPGSRSLLDELNKRYRTWDRNRERFFLEVKESGVPDRSIEVLNPLVNQLSERITQLKKRAFAR